MRKKNAQNELYIPNEIRRITGNQKFVYNHTGMSASKVLIFPAYVLKIQPQSPETENEKEIAAWIADKKKERKEGKGADLYGHYEEEKYRKESGGLFFGGWACFGAFRGLPEGRG